MYLLPPFTCARVISSYWSVCIGVDILEVVRSISGNGNISLLKTLKTFSLTPESVYKLSRVFVFTLKNSF